MTNEYPPELYKNAHKWIAERIDDRKKSRRGYCEVIDIDDSKYGSSGSNTIHFRIVGDLGGIVEDFLKIFPQFNIYNIHTSDLSDTGVKGVTIVFTTDGDTF